MLECRFYSNRFPKEGDIVMVTVNSIAELGVYVTLPEYNNIEGMIPFSELSRRRIRSVHRLVRVGRNECVIVTKVDLEKGYLDLSKRRVSAQAIAQCEERFAKSKIVNSILEYVGDLLGYESDNQLEDLYRETAWYFIDKHNKPTACYDIFRRAIEDPEVLNECNIDEKTKEILLVNINRRLSPHKVKIRADIEVVCTNYEGIDAVKRALKMGFKFSTEIIPIKVGTADQINWIIPMAQSYIHDQTRPNACSSFFTFSSRLPLDSYDR